jgi:hypothetical protein
MQVFITKYALTQGILVAEAEDVGDGMVHIPGSTEKGTFSCYFHEGDWFLTLAEAETKREQMISRKRKSLEKALRDLDSKRNLPVKPMS